MGLKDWVESKLHILNYKASYNFPYYDWWKCRKWIKRPHIHFSGVGKWRKVWRYGMPMGYHNPILSVKSSNVGWKDKYDSPCFEYNPYIYILIFRKWAIVWTIGWNRDYVENLTTWEAILAHNYYNEDIKEFAKHHYWLTPSGQQQVIHTLK